MSNMIQAVDWGNRTQSNQIPISYWTGVFSNISTATGGTVTTIPLTQAEVQAFNSALADPCGIGKRLLSVSVALPKLPKVSGHNPCLHGCAIALIRMCQ